MPPHPDQAAPPEFGTGRETVPVVVPGPDGDRAGEQMTGPVHAVQPGAEDLELVTSLCNHSVRATAGAAFDAGDPDACPTCVERSGQGRGSPR